MKINLSVEVNIDPERLASLTDDPAFWTFAAEEWHRLYTPWVPRDTGKLFQTVTIRPGEIEHTMPYARKLYEGHFNLRPDYHPLASREWDKAAEPTQREALVAALQAYVNGGGLNLGG